MLRASASLLAEAPVIGHGLGSTTELFRHDARIATDIQYPHPHNAYAQYAVEMGAPGLVLLAVLFGGAIVFALRAQRSVDSRVQMAARISLVLTAALMLEGLFEVLFYNAKMAFLSVGCLGLAYALPGLLRRTTAETT